MLTPPTDSLYKFMAIFGLVLIVTVYVLDNKIQQSFNEALAAKLAEDAKVYEQISEQSKKSLELTRKLPQIRDGMSDADAQQAKEILEQLGALSKTVKDFQRTEQYIRAERSYEFVNKKYGDVVIMNSLLLLAGIILVVAGFWLWYVRVQRYLDISIRVEAERQQVMPAAQQVQADESASHGPAA